MLESELPPPQPRRTLTLGLMHLSRPRHVLRDVFEAVDALVSWPYAPNVACPSHSAIIRAKELVLAVGPLSSTGPREVVVAPSVRGGVVTSFFNEAAAARDISVATLNNHVSLLVLGKGWTGALEVVEVAHAEAVARAQALSRL